MFGLLIVLDHEQEIPTNLHALCQLKAIWIPIISGLIIIPTLILIYNLGDTSLFRMDILWIEHVHKYKWKLSKNGTWKRNSDVQDNNDPHIKYTKIKRSQTISNLSSTDLGEYGGSLIKLASSATLPEIKEENTQRSLNGSTIHTMRDTKRMNLYTSRSGSDYKSDDEETDTVLHKSLTKLRNVHKAVREHTEPWHRRLIIYVNVRFSNKYNNV